MNMSAVIVFFFVVVFSIAGTILLQIFLSKKESKWLGLVLPAITLLFSLIVVLGIPAYTVSQTFLDGKVIASTVDPIGTGTFMTVFFVFVLFNIPTAILMAIYGACRGRNKRNAALERMSIQDLE